MVQFGRFIKRRVKKCSTRDKPPTSTFTLIVRDAHTICDAIDLLNFFNVWDFWYFTVWSMGNCVSVSGTTDTFQRERKKRKRCLFKEKSLRITGLHQSGREWCPWCLDKFLKSINLTKDRKHSCACLNENQDLIVGVYVDDLLVIDKNRMILVIS